MTMRENGEQGAKGCELVTSNFLSGGKGKIKSLTNEIRSQN
jgi:hypothetical protein